MKDSAEDQEVPVLLAELWKWLQGTRAIYGQERVFGSVVGLVLAELFSLGRQTVTQLIRTVGPPRAIGVPATASSVGGVLMKRR